MESHLTDITHVIQLAVAPVFLLTALATLINALNSRLGRIVDRRRVVERSLRDLSGENRAESSNELDHLHDRARLIYYAIFAAVLGALLICLVVAGAFLGALFAVELARWVAVFFILAMLSTVGSLTLLLREVFLAVRSAPQARH
jgi:hypothetical protein